MSYTPTERKQKFEELELRDPKKYKAQKKLAQKKIKDTKILLLAGIHKTGSMNKTDRMNLTGWTKRQDSEHINDMYRDYPLEIKYNKSAHKTQSLRHTIDFDKPSWINNSRYQDV